VISGTVVTVLAIIRYAVLAAVVVAVAAAVGSWAVRTRRINPFSRVGRFSRRLSDLVVVPMETQLIRRGANPVNAGWWIAGIALAGGIALISLSEWLVTQALQVSAIAAAGPRGIVRLVIYYASQLVLLALIIRVFGSWFGVGRYTRWMRPVFLLTDWLVEPLRRVIPPFGIVDVTPLVAWLLLLLVRGWLLTVI
jgi:YggT family protein